jgi:hypothetical protein
VRYPGKINDIFYLTLKGLSRRGRHINPIHTLVVFNPVLFEKASRLVLKGYAAVMLLLLLNVPADTIEI